MVFGFYDRVNKNFLPEFEKVYLILTSFDCLGSSQENQKMIMGKLFYNE